MGRAVSSRAGFKKEVMPVHLKPHTDADGDKTVLHNRAGDCQRVKRLKDHTWTCRPSGLNHSGFRKNKTRLCFIKNRRVTKEQEALEQPYRTHDVLKPNISTCFTTFTSDKQKCQNLLLTWWYVTHQVLLVFKNGAGLVQACRLSWLSCVCLKRTFPFTVRFTDSEAGDWKSRASPVCADV